MSQEPLVTFLTQDAYDRLHAELEELSVNGRHEIAKRIESAREEGDLKENGGYHAAREEQGKQENRIRYLQQLLRDAKVGGAPKSDAVAAGTVVTVQFDDDKDDTETFLLGSREISSTTELTVYSPESALGKAILGAHPGDTVTYTAPSGAEVKVTVISFEAFTG
jgi:transcription elongation factor GreA